MVHKIGARAERRVEREELADLKRVHGETKLLFRLAEAALANPDGTVSDVLFPITNEQTLQDLVREHHSSDSIIRTKAKTYLRASYSRHYRRIVPKVLAALTFNSTNTAHRPVLEGIELIKAYVGRKERLFPVDEIVPMDGVVPTGWRSLVVTTDADGLERVNRVSYEICETRCGPGCGFGTLRRVRRDPHRSVTPLTWRSRCRSPTPRPDHRRCGSTRR